MFIFNAKSGNGDVNNERSVSAAGFFEDLTLKLSLLRLCFGILDLFT